MESGPITGDMVSLQQLADRESGAYFRIPFQESSLLWTRQTRLEGEKGHELAEFRDLLIIDVFNVYSLRQRVFIDEVSYPNALSLWGVNHARTERTLEVRTSKPIEVIEEPVFIVGGHDNHYHWLLNWLPRTVWLERLGRLASLLSNCKLMVHGGISAAHLDSLRLMGFSTDRILRARGDRYYHLKHAWVPSFYRSDCYNRDINAYLRESYRHIHDISPSSDLIYIDRNAISTPRRRVHNMADVIDVLESFGVRSIRLEDLTFAEQVRSFSNARAVIAPHGAGLANLVFCGPGTKLIVFEYKQISEFVELAKISGLKPTSLLCNQYVDEAYEQTAPRFEPRLRDLIVNCDALRSALSAIV